MEFQENFDLSTNDEATIFVYIKARLEHSFRFIIDDLERRGKDGWELQIEAKVSNADKEYLARHKQNEDDDS